MLTASHYSRNYLRFADCKLFAQNVGVCSCGSIANKLSCGAGHNKPRSLLRRSGKPKTAISLHSQSLGGGTGLPEDHNQTK